MSAVEVIVLKKSFWGDERKFLEPLMRFARGGMRDHIVSHKNDHGASYRRYGVLPWRSRIKINFLRDFRRRSIFDFCNTIEVRADERRAPFDFRKTKGQLQEALCGDGIVEQGGRPLGLFQPTLQFFAVALFIHGEHSLSGKTREHRDGSHFFRSSIWNGFKRGYHSVALPKLNIVTVD